MATYGRVKTWGSEVLEPSDLNTEFDNIVNNTNDMNSDNLDMTATYAWTGGHTFGTTVGITGVTTHGGNVVSDTDSTDDLGTTSVRWANLYVDDITVTTDVAATTFTGALAATSTIADGVTATTQSASDNSTKVATTAYADAAAAGGVTLTGSTNNTIATVTGADALQGEANLTFDGTLLGVGGSTSTSNWSPTAYVNIEGGIPALGLRDTTASADDWLLVNNNGVLTIANDTNNTQDLVIDESGNVGIGTSSPDGTLHVHTATAGTVTASTTANDLVVENSGDGGISILNPIANKGYLMMGAPNDNEGFIMWYDHTTGDASFDLAGNTNSLYHNAGPQWLIKDTSNANQSSGLTIQQGANDNEILALKSSDVAHGMTTIAETDTYGTIRKTASGEGGLRIDGFTENTIGSIQFQCRDSGDHTLKSSGAGASASFYVAKANGTGITSHSSNHNLMGVGDGSTGTFKWLVDQEGDVHYDGTTNAGAWDDHEDIQLLNTVRNLTTGNKAPEIFGEFVSENAQLLHDTGVITMNDDGHHFVSTKGLNALIIDTVRQEGANWRKAVAARDVEIAELKASMSLLMEKN